MRSVCCIGLRNKPKCFIKKYVYMINDFLSFCENGRNLSKQTMKQYTIVLHTWQQFCELCGISVETATSENAMQWVLFQSRNGIKAVTINNRVSIVRTMYDFACRFLGHDVNPFVAIQRLKVPKLLPQFIEDATIRQAVANFKGTDFLSVRARTVVMFFYCTGIRRTELATLQLSDVDDAAKVIHVFGKGRKERLVPMADALLPFIHDWLIVRSVTLPHASPWFFCSSAGEPICNTTLAAIVREVFGSLIPRKLAHPHALRHSFATHCMQSGLPIPDIGRLLGHANTATTLRYLSLSAPSMYSSFINKAF